MSVINSPSPIPRPRSASPVYSHKAQKPSPHIMPKPDMIRSYSATSTPSSTITASPQPEQLYKQPLQHHSHDLMISFLQGIGGLGVILFFVMLWAVRGNNKPKPKQKMHDYEGFHVHDYTQQINPTAYNTLNLIRRGSSNSLASGNISPV